MKKTILHHLKKVMSSALAFLILITSLAPSAIAAGEPTLTLGSQTALNGDTIFVPLTAKDFTTGVGGVTLTIQFDGSLLSYQNHTLDPLLTGALVTVNDGQIDLNWFDATLVNPIDLADATLLTLEFTVITDATVETNLSLLSTEISDNAGDPIGDVVTFDGIISLNPAPATLESIAVTTPPDKINYGLNEALEIGRAHV